MTSNNGQISTEVVGPKLTETFHGIVPGKNGKLYLIPASAGFVVSFDPKTNDWTEIGDDFYDLDEEHLERGFEDRWWGGVLADNGKIYCAPYNSFHILVIDTNTETTSLIPLPEEMHWFRTEYKFAASSLDKNGNVYFFPDHESMSFLLKINPATDTISTIEIKSGCRWWYATLSSKNGHIYVIPGFNSGCYIMDFDPTTENVTEIHEPDPCGHINEIGSNMYSQLVEHDDGHLYAIARRNTMKIDVSTSIISFFHYDLVEFESNQSILGKNGDIYTISWKNGKVVRFNPYTKTTTTCIAKGYVSNSYNWYGTNWWGMCIGYDGNGYYGYCAPSKASNECKIQILKVNISERGHWIYLRHRLLIHDSRATTINMRQVVEEERDDLAIIQIFVTQMNDDEFRHTLQFV